MASNRHTAPKRKFPGFSGPKYTGVPDVLFDELLAELSGSELKVLLYLMRRTFGFKKDSDHISLNQICNGITTKGGRVLDKGTGLSVSTAVAALKSLVEQDIVRATRNRTPHKGDQPTTYSLNVLSGEPDPVSENHLPPVFENRRGGSLIIEEARLRKSKTQETGIQETVPQETEVLETHRVSSYLQDLSSEFGRETAKNLDGYTARETSNPTAPANPERQEPARRTTTHKAGFTPIGQLILSRPASTESHKGEEGSETQNQSLEPGINDPLRAHQNAPDAVSPGSAITLPTRRKSTAQISTTARQTAPPLEEWETPRLDHAVEEMSRTLGDWRHRRSNVTQARHLFQESGYNEAAFTQLVWDMIHDCRDRAGAIKGPKGAYFFAALRGEIERRHSGSGGDESGRRSLAGSYAHLVHR